MTPDERARNQAAYERLKSSIDQSYPLGCFVAIANARIVAASADLQDVERLVRAEGLDPRDVMVVEAGVNEPDYVDIFVGLRN